MNFKILGKNFKDLWFSGISGFVFFYNLMRPLYTAILQCLCDVTSVAVFLQLLSQCNAVICILFPCI